MFRKLILASVLGVTGFAMTAGTATAGDCCYKYVTRVKCVITYETHSEPYTKTVTLYDHCGKPYCVTKTCYRDVQVPVKKYVTCVEKVPCY